MVHPPRQTPPPRIWSMSGWYTSCWNAFLLPPANEVCEGYVFTCVCHSIHRGGVCPSACWNAHPHPPGPKASTPQDQRQAPPGPEAGTPHGTRGRHPPPGPEADPPQDQRQTPPPGPEAGPRSSACWEIWATSGRYASYWNTFLY